MNCTTRCISKWATAAFALAIAIAVSPASRAEDQPSSPAASQPAATAQPAAAAQPTADQRLEELEKEVMLLQQEIAALKNEGAPEMKTAAYAIPGTAASAGSLAPASPAEDAPKINLAGLLGPVTLSGFGDVYASYNPNHPFDNKNGLEFFDANTNTFSFNMAELILDKAADANSSEGRLGYHVSAGYGQAANVVNGSDFLFTDHSNFFLKEAYVSYLAPIGSGLTFTVGKFVTNAGAEVIETNANWNYTRSLLFNFAIPFFHFGAKAAYTFNPKWSANISVVNGWNNTTTSHNPALVENVTAPGQSASSLTYGGTVVFTPNAKWTATENFYSGPVIDQFGVVNGKSKTYNDWKQLSDTVLGYTPNAKWAFQLNGDYGWGPRLWNCEGACVPATGPFVWWGVAGYAKYTFNPKNNFAVRYEYYGDPDGFTITGLDDPDTRHHLQEVTGTYTWNLTNALMIRGEYRYDFSSLPIFTKGSTFNARKVQNIALVGFVYSFSSANAK